LLKSTIYIFLALLTMSSFAVAQPAGDPNHQGRLEFTYSDRTHMAKIDGETVDVTNGMKAVMALSHGKHHLQIYKVKGMFSMDLASEQKLFIPGGYIVRATLSDGKVDIFDHVPVPGLNLSTPPAPPAQPAQPALESTTTTTTTTVTSSSGTTDETMSFSFGVGNESISTSMSLPGMSGGMAVTEKTTVTTTTTGTTPPPQVVAAPVAVVQNRPSRIVLMSEKGMADVYLDGEEKGELDLAMIDEMSKLTIWDVNPGSYLLKVEGFEVWYNGTLKVGSGEEIKIQVEPNKFKIIGRNPLP